MFPLISVIIPIYNVEKYVKRCLDSVLNQTYCHLEVILVDDGSTDSSGKICDEYKKMDTRIRVIHKSNEGVSSARNLGIEVANGEYIAFIDSDDAMEKDCIEYLYRLIQENHCSLSICSYRIRFEGKNKYHNTGRGGQEVLPSEKCIEKMLYGEDGIDVFPWGKLYHRSIMGAIRYPHGKLAQDVGTTYKFMQAAKWIACGYQCKYNYWIRKNSATTQRFKRAHFDLIEMGDQMTTDICKWYPELWSAAIRYRVWTRFSVLNRMTTASKQYIPYRQEIVSYIRENAKFVLQNPKAPVRDKLAIWMLSCGLSIYRGAWKIYCHVMK